MGATITVALAGDTMLGRGVAERLARSSPQSLFSPEVVEAAREADLFLLNLECCVSERGEPWQAPGKPFFFRAPPAAVDALVHLGVDCVTLANNHALDFGEVALLDTVGRLSSAGIGVVGAGHDLAAARAPVVLEANGLSLGVIGVTDHPSDFDAQEGSPGVAFADLSTGVPAWLSDTVRGMDSDVVLVTAHWGPNMASEPVGRVRAAGPVLLEAGASVIAGHSAHVFQGVQDRILYDLGDFVDDYAVDPVLRNDLGLLWLLTVGASGPVRLEVLPLRLDCCHTRLARGEDADWIRTRFRQACASFGTDVSEDHGRLVVHWRDG